MQNGKVVKMAKKKLKWANIVVFSIILIVVLSFIWFAFLKDNFSFGKNNKNSLNIKEYNGYVFVKQNESWFFDFEKDNNVYNIPLYYNPLEVENISSDNISFSDIYEKNLYYLTLDSSVSPKSVVAAVEVAKIFGQAEYGILKKQIKSALAYEYGAVLQITCQNATKDIGVIYLLVSNETRIKKEGDCIILSAQNEDDMMKLAVKLDYISLGIIK